MVPDNLHNSAAAVLNNGAVRACVGVRVLFILFFYYRYNLRLDLVLTVVIIGVTVAAGHTCDPRRFVGHRLIPIVSATAAADLVSPSGGSSLLDDRVLYSTNIITFGRDVTASLILCSIAKQQRFALYYVYSSS